MAKALVRGVEKWIGKFHDMVEGPGKAVVFGLGLLFFIERLENVGIFKKSRKPCFALQCYSTHRKPRSPHQ